MVSIVKAIKAEFFKFYFDVKRYMFNYIVGLISTAIFLSGLYWAVNALFMQTGQAVAFVGLLLWLFASSALSNATNHLSEERYLGTLERISVTKTLLIHILIARNVVHCLFTLTQSIVVGGILYVVFKPDLGYMLSSWKVSLMAVVIGILIVVTLYAFGFFIASLGMILKRVGAITSILEYLILFFSGIVVPWSSMPAPLRTFSNILPMTWGIKALDSLLNGSDFRWSFAGLIIYTVVITIISTRTFRYATMLVKKKGEYAFY
ncbi:MAG TPA: ABC transporter permease [Firmicutes bacterium]|nr:ABC transporter permease [Candidatus Fermentithermobacillaceae bacterium]